MAEGFKTSLMGFSKQEVLEYIASLSADYGKQLAEKDEEITALRAKNSELKKKLRELRISTKGKK